jgi:hypothetical protein
MVSNKFLLERSLDMVIPLLALSIYMSVLGRGFPTLWPVAAATVYAFVQPFFRFFVFDRLRDAFFSSDRFALYFLGVGIVYSTLAVGIARLFL